MMPESLPRRFWPEDEWPATHGARVRDARRKWIHAGSGQAAGECEARFGWQGKEAYADGTLVR